MRDIYIDSRLPQHIIDQGGYEIGGLEYVDLYYMPYRRTKWSKVILLISNRSVMFLNPGDINNYFVFNRTIEYYI